MDPKHCVIKALLCNKLPLSKQTLSFTFISFDSSALLISFSLADNIKQTF